MLCQIRTPNLPPLFSSSHVSGFLCQTVIASFTHMLVQTCWCSKFTSALQHTGLYNPNRRLSALCIDFFYLFFLIIISVCSVGQRMFPSGLHHTNEEEESRCRVSTEAPSALQSHLFDTQR